MTVSVLIITYNHAPFIEQALDSVLAQETSFPLEIVVSDDASTDGTSEIVRRYAERHPGALRAVLRASNIGANRNYIEALLACRGRYIALLEGDDYWLSPRKLQRQVDELEAHPDAVMCTHPVKVIAGHDQSSTRVTSADPRDVMTFEDIVRYRYPLPTCATVMRNVLREVPSWFYEIHNLDYATQLMAARHGNVRVLHEPMAVYRQHPGGISQSTGASERIARFIHLLHCANAELGFTYDALFRRRLAALYRSQVKVELGRGRFGAAARAAWGYTRSVAASSAVAAGKRTT